MLWKVGERSGGGKRDLPCEVTGEICELWDAVDRVVSEEAT